MNELMDEGMNESKQAEFSLSSSPSLSLLAFLFETTTFPSLPPPLSPSLPPNPTLNTYAYTYPYPSNCPTSEKDYVIQQIHSGIR